MQHDLHTSLARREFLTSQVMGPGRTRGDMAACSRRLCRRSGQADAGTADVRSHTKTAACGAVGAGDDLDLYQRRSKPDRSL